jgi:hypothetical protein
MARSVQEPKQGHRQARFRPKNERAGNLRMYPMKTGDHFAVPAADLAVRRDILIGVSP